MGFFDLVDMTVAYVQYIYLLVSISPNSFPTFFVEPFVSLQFLAFDVLNQFSEGYRYNNPLTITLPDWIPLDARLSFVLIVVVLPMLISLLGSLVVSKGVTFLWILSMNASIFALIFGALLVALPWIYPVALLKQRSRVLLTVIGGFMCILLITTGFLGLWILRTRRKRNEEEIIMATLNSEQLHHTVSLTEKAVTRVVTNRRALAALQAYEKTKELYLAKRTISSIISLAVLTCACLVGAFISIGYPSLKRILFYQGSLVGRGVGIFLFVCATLSFIWLVLSSFKEGRKLQMILYAQISYPLLMLALILISFIYSPVLLHMVNVLWCTLVVCESGKRLTVPGSLAHFVGTNSVWEPPIDLCTACSFNTTSQNCPASLQQLLCLLPMSQLRLAYDRNVPCEYIDIFYKAAILIMFCSYTLAYPIFLVVVANRATKILENEFPLEKRICDEFTEKELYYEKVRKSKNISAGIYEVFKRRYRMARLTFLLERVLFTIISAITRRGLEENLSWLGIVLILVVAVIYLAYTSILRPFARPVENFYNAIHQLTIIIVGCLGLVGSLHGRDAVPFGIAVLVAVLTFVAPIAALVVGFGSTFRMDRERAKRLQHRLQRGFSIVQKEKNRGDGASSHLGDSASFSVTRRSTVETDDESRRGSRNRSDTRMRADKGIRGSLPEGKKLEMPRNKLCMGDSVPIVVNHYSKDVVSAPNTEKEPFEVTAADGEKKPSGGVARSGPVSRKEAARDNNSQGQSEFNIGNAENETVEEDDYFGDKRVFLPANYFKDYKEVPVQLTESTKETHQNKAGIKSPGSSIYLQATRRVVPASQRLHGANPGASQLNEGLTPPHRTIFDSHNVHSENTGGDDQGSVGPETNTQKWQFIPTLSRYFRNVLTLTDYLRYKDVLQRRKELQMSTGILRRPFWIEPDETQQQNLRATGRLTPSLCARNAPQLDINTFSGTLFARIRERKASRTKPLVVTDAKLTGEEKGNIPILLSARRETPRCAYNGGFRRSFCSADSSTIEMTGFNAPLPKKVVTKSPLTSTAGAGLISLFAEPEVHQVVSVRENSVEEGESQRAKGPPQFTLLVNSQCKLDQIKERCPRGIEKRPLWTRRLSMTCVPVISNVRIEGSDINDWDVFVGRLINDIHTPFEKENNENTKRVAEQQNSISRRQGQQHQQREVLEDDEEEEERQCRKPQPSNMSAQQKGEQMSQLRRHTLLRRRLLTAFKLQREKLASLQQAVDHRIALTVKKYMQALFMALSFFAAFAFVLCICGMLNSRDKSFVDGVRKDRSVAYQLMGYDSWSSFTLNCCCSPNVNITPEYPYYALDTESWICADGRSKERVRRDVYTNEVVSGYAVRSLCGMEFKNNCQLEVDGDRSVRLTGCVGVPLNEQQRW